MRSGKMRIDSKSFAILHDSVLGVALIDQVLSEKLVHAGGIGGDHGERLARLRGQIGVDSINDVKNIGVGWICVLEQTEHTQCFLHIPALIIELDQSQPRADLQLWIRRQMRNGLLQKRLRRVEFALGLFAQTENRQRFPEGRLKPQCRPKILARLCVFSLQKLDNPQISPRLHVLRIERQNGAELTKCGIELLLLHRLMSSGKVLADLALRSGRGLLGKEDERERKRNQEEGRYF